MIKDALLLIGKTSFKIALRFFLLLIPVVLLNWLFAAIFGTVFFSQMVPNGAPDGLNNVTKSEKKNNNIKHKGKFKCAPKNGFGYWTWCRLFALSCSWTRYLPHLPPMI